MRLNIGSGAPGPEGWTNINLLPGENIDYAIDVREGLPFDDNSVDYAVCHHVLDLLTREDVLGLIDDVYRVLKPGGMFRASLADILGGVEAAQMGNWSFFAEPKTTMEETVGFFITQGGARQQCRLMWCINTWLKRARFARAVQVPFGWSHGPKAITDLDSREGESLFFEAMK